MYITKPTTKQLYNEKEAAEVLGIPVLLLHAILDEHVFNEGTPRPESIEFTASDLLLIGYWVETATRQRQNAATAGTP
jgi:hypothetical protein